MLNEQSNFAKVAHLDSCRKANRKPSKKVDIASHYFHTRVACMRLTISVRTWAIR